MISKKAILLIVFIVLLFGNLFFGFNYFYIQKELQAFQENTAKQVTNIKVVNFMKTFIEKVLKAKEDVSIQDRRRMEGYIENLEDESVLAQWRKFINSKTEKEAQEGVTNLLESLVNKISY